MVEHMLECGILSFENYFCIRFSLFKFLIAFYVIFSWRNVTKMILKVLVFNYKIERCDKINSIFCFSITSFLFVGSWFYFLFSTATFSWRSIFGLKHCCEKRRTLEDDIQNWLLWSISVILSPWWYDKPWGIVEIRSFSICAGPRKRANILTSFAKKRETIL